MTSQDNNSLILFGSPISTFVRKVQLLLEYKGIPYRIEMPERATLLAISPLGKVPVLQDGGANIIDSSVICDYLERRFPQRSLYPADLALRAQALWIEEYADTALADSGYGFFNECLLKPKVYGLPTDPEARETARVGLGVRLDYLEQILDGEFFVGDQLSIADLTVGTVLINPLRVGFVVDPKRWPKVSSYLDTLFAREPFATRLADTHQAFVDLENRAPKPAA
ncbi:MAG: glutathione S-transferase family protein [Spongiibacteraceae bacterium]